MLKVLFYHANDCLTDKDIPLIFLGIASLYLKTHLELTQTEISKDIEWLLPIQQKMSDKEFIEHCYKTQPDIICSSHYIWNHAFLLGQLERIKNKIPSNIVIAAGGPSIDVNINNNFFNDFPFIDYAMYGAGEQAFADMIVSIVTGKKLIKFNTSNLAWVDKKTNETVVADFKYVPQHKISPFLHNKEFFSEIIKDIQNQNLNPVVPYELTRGCPYSCTFCDWNSGLSNKVSRRKNSYIDEIDFFQQLKVKNLYLSDANVGQYDEDVEMIEYLAQKNIVENAEFKIDGNYSKLRKDNNLKIYHIMGNANLNTEFHGFTMSVQDINKEVLKNIDRPDVGWDVHLKIIYELKQAFPDKHSKVQVIQGLPGQTLESWQNTLSEICKHPVTLQPFISELLPASPAARDQSYQERFRFEYSNCERYEASQFWRGTIPKSCYSFTQIDFVKMTICSIFYTALLLIRASAKQHFNFDEIYEDFQTTIQYKILVNDLYNNWNKNNKFYFTLNLDLKPQLCSASDINSTRIQWQKSFFMVKFMADYMQEDRSLFLKKAIVFKENKIDIALRHIEGYV